MNLPLSSMTPVSSPDAWRSCILSMAAWVFSLKCAAKSSSRTTFCACKNLFLNIEDIRNHVACHGVSDHDSDNSINGNKKIKGLHNNVINILRSYQRNWIAALVAYVCNLLIWSISQISLPLCNQQSLSVSYYCPAPHSPQNLHPQLWKPLSEPHILLVRVFYALPQLYVRLLPAVVLFPMKFNLVNLIYNLIVVNDSNG